MINKDLLNFSEFLDFYKEKYGKPSSEISMPKPDDEDEQCVDLIPLVESNYIMLDFDLMCKDANFYPKKTKEECNRPSTVDALYYRFLNENELELSLIEFKSFNFDWDKDRDYNSSLNKVLNKLEDDEYNIDNFTQLGIDRLNSIRDSYGNTIEFSLRLKPYESLFVVLPKLYDEYCVLKNVPDEEKLNLYTLFQSDSCIIKLFIVGKQNKDLNKAYLGKLGSLLEKQYKRLDYVNVLTPHDFRECFPNEFDSITILLNMFDRDKDTLKSLNKH